MTEGKYKNWEGRVEFIHFCEEAGTVGEAAGEYSATWPSGEHYYSSTACSVYQEHFPSARSYTERGLGCPAARRTSDTRSMTCPVAGTGFSNIFHVKIRLGRLGQTIYPYSRPSRRVRVVCREQNESGVHNQKLNNI